MDKTFAKRIKSKTSEILVEESLAEPGEKVHAERCEEQHEVRGQVPGVDVGHPHEHQVPDTQGDKSGSETKQFLAAKKQL